ncbi:MAG: right-handed parallel beta-helix repeat-containing protein [candidate division WS1 bacterium]|nr:right-handed parallel beta-helix repeat-containing protein [candidate division WS1 bacterium]
MMQKVFVIVTAALVMAAPLFAQQVNQEMIDQVAAGEIAEARASWWGFNPEDSTEALQAAINSGAAKLIVEDMGSPWIVTPIKLASDQEIIFEEGCEILAKRGEFKGRNDTLFTASGVENVTLRGYGATWRMWREDYDNPELYEKAEWRHCLTLRNTDNINVYGLTLTESGGDGIYFGAGGDGNINIHIKDLVCDRNYRQGISVITGENVLIEDTIMSNTGGTPPAAGIDFEPNWPSERLVNFVMRNCLTENNEGDGYEFYLPNMHAETPDVSVRIENCRSVNDRTAVRVITGNAPELTVGGFIEFADCEFVNSDGPAISVGDKPVEGLRLTFDNCVVESPASERVETSPIAFATRQRAVRDVGGVDFGELVLRDDIERQPLSFASMALGTNLTDVTGTIVLVRNGERMEIELTEELLAEWAPRSEVPAIPLVSLEGCDFVPVVADPPADAVNAPATIRLRKASTVLLYAEEGDEVSVTAYFGQVGTSPATEAPIVVVSPAGEEIATARIPFEEEGEVTFTAPETGLYQLQAKPGSKYISYRASSHPINLTTEGAPVGLIAGGGTLYVWVPEGVQEFGIVATGEGAGEGIKVALYDPEGELVQEEDDVAAAVLLHARLDAPSQGEAWRIDVSRASELYFEDHSLLVRGVPPLLAPSPEALLRVR